MPTATWWKKHRSHGRLSKNCLHCKKEFAWRSAYLGRYTDEGKFVAIHVDCFLPMRNAAIALSTPPEGGEV